jgi:hypothetical protein
MFIDVAIPGGWNVIQKEAEKILKYKDLTIEIQRMWNVKTRAIPVSRSELTNRYLKQLLKYINSIDLEKINQM